MSTINIGTSSNTAFKVESDTTGALTIKTGAGLTTAVTVSATQQVGFGATPSAWSSGWNALQFIGDGSVAGLSGGYMFMSQNFYADPTDKFIGTGYATMYYQQAGVHKWRVSTASGTAGNAITWSDKLTLDASGNLGLGVTPSSATIPTFQMTYGGTLSNDSDGSQLLAYNARKDTNWKYIASATASLYQQVNGAHYWYTAASGTAGNAITWTTAMALDASGNLFSTPTYNSTTGSAANLVITGAYQFARSTSARKYKTNERDLEDVDINVFRPVRYNSLCAADDPLKDYIGLVADDYVNSYPELVTFGANNEVEGFAYERMTAVLCKFAQQQKAEIDALKAEVALLKGNQ